MMGRMFNSGLAATAALVLLVFSPAVSSYPQLQHQFRTRAIHHHQVKDTYDYIVVGGGQSGLVVANRLSENSNGT